MTKQTLLKLALICLFLSSLMSQRAVADTIQVSKNNKVLILSEQEGTYSVGDRIYAVDSNGKKKAIIQVQKVNGLKVIGKVVKSVKNLELKGMSVIGGTQSSTSSSSGSKQFAAGVMVGLGMDSMTVKVAGSTIAMSGMGYSFKAFGDYNFTSSIGVRLFGGMESFNVKKSESAILCDGSAECKTEISYLTGDAWLRYTFLQSLRLWLGAGVGGWIPMSKTSNNLDTTTIGFSSAIYFGGGADITVGDDLFVPFQVEYIMLPSASADVTANAIAFRAGLGYSF